MKNNLNYARSNIDAEVLYKKWRSLDPFPNISPALLNTADIADYISKTGMIYPFKSENLKSASYEMDIGGEVLYWDAKGKKNVISKMSPGDTITFNKNSITYVTVDAYFRLPDYIALRFNFQIKHVHRGLLLGTGPLVNPGFCGHLMIPIHNLTDNDYNISYGQPLIGVEFTKISINDAWKNSSKEPQYGKYEPNHKKKNNKSFSEFLEVALPDGTIGVSSSLSATLHDAKNQVKESNEAVSDIRKETDQEINKIKEEYEKKLNTFWGIGVTALVVGFLTFMAVMYEVASIVSEANKYVSDASMVFKDSNGEYIYLKSKEKIDEIIQINDKQSNDINNLNRFLDESRSSNKSISEELEKLRKKIK